MSEQRRIVGPSAAEQLHRYADLEERAAAAFGSEISTTSDSKRRQQLGEKIKKHRAQAALHRAETEKLAVNGSA